MIEVPSLLFPVSHHGFDASGESGDQFYGTCPFCLEEKFYIHPETGQWICHGGECEGRSGNVISFLDQYVQYLHDKTDVIQLQPLATKRGVQLEVLEDRVVYDEQFDRYIIPVFKPNGHVQDLRTYKLGQKVRSTKGCKSGLCNLEVMLEGDYNEVFICAGEWDWLVMLHIIDELGLEGCTAVGVPGESIFKEEWIDHFKGRNVTILYDNDLPGFKGMLKVAEKLRRVASSIRFVQWPDGMPDGFDLNDMYKVCEQDAKFMWRELRRFIVDELKDEEPAEQKPVLPRKKTIRRTFAAVANEYRKWLKMDRDSVNILKLMYSTILAVKIPEDPPWMYVVGPSGAGKTVLLQTTRTSDHVVYRSSITPTTLVSGQKAGDPSLIPQLDGKALFFKDLTEILSMAEGVQEEIWAVLRGAFDGYVERSYGNGVYRQYESHFTLVAGVTGAINSALRKGRALGDRFLRYQMRKTPELINEQVRAAIRSIGKETARKEALEAISQEFVDSRFDDFDPSQYEVPKWFEDKVVSLVDLMSFLRAMVMRTQEGTILYRPEREIGSRFGKQLTKLAFGLCVVEDKPEIDWDIYKLIRRVAFDTAEGFSMDIVRAAMERGGTDLSIDDLSELSNLPKDTLRECLDDLQILSVMYYTRVRDQSPEKGALAAKTTYNVAMRIRQLWNAVEGEGVD